MKCSMSATLFEKGLMKEIFSDFLFTLKLRRKHGAGGPHMGLIGPTWPRMGCLLTPTCAPNGVCCPTYGTHMLIVGPRMGSGGVY